MTRRGYTWDDSRLIIVKSYFKVVLVARFFDRKKIALVVSFRRVLVPPVG